MFEGDAGTGATITSLAPARDVARAWTRCLTLLRGSMRAARWVGLGSLVLLALLTPPNVVSLVVLLVGAAVIVWVTSTVGLTWQYLQTVRETPSLTIPQTVTLEPGGLRFLDHESDRRYAWQHWQAVHDLAEGLALELQGGWQADLLHASAFTSPEQRSEWLAAINAGIAGRGRPPS
jgi:hypothetical protein